MRKFQLQQNESKRGLLILGDLGLHIFSSFFPLRVKKSYIFFSSCSSRLIKKINIKQFVMYIKHCVFP